uniref:Uncharacterized protein n=1 Tax=Syphacia muris TaxID=451379 RepID=A0A0N5AX79_9BILA
MKKEKKKWEGTEKISLQTVIALRHSDSACLRQCGKQNNTVNDNGDDSCCGRAAAAVAVAVAVAVVDNLCSSYL